MATQTVINQTQMTAEQKALAAAELEQLKRRMAFENFAGEILLGFKPGGPSSTTQTVPTIPTATGSTPTVPTGVGGGNSALGNAVGSVGQLQQGIAHGGIGSSGSGIDIGKYLTPGLIGGAAGLALGGLSGVRPGATVGNVIGDALTDMSPEVNRPDSTGGTSPPIEVNRPDTTQGNVPNAPSQGQLSAASAMEHALGNLYNQASNAQVSRDAAQHELDAGGLYGQAMGNYYSAAASSFANTAYNSLIEQGFTPESPGFSEAINKFVMDSMARWEASIKERR